MINLNKLFANGPQVTLLEPRDYTGPYVPQLRLLLTDRETGYMQVLTIEADAFIEPRVAPMLAISVEDVDEPEFSDETGEWVDDSQSSVFDEIEPRVEWCVTPGGEEIDLRGDGLFG